MIVTTANRKIADSLKPIVVALLDDDESPYDISQFTTFTLKVRNRATPPALVIDKAMVITNLAKAEVTYVLLVADLVVAGTHDVEVLAVGPSGQVRFPQKGYNELVVEANLG